MRLKKYCLLLIILCTYSVSALALPQYDLQEKTLNQSILQYADLNQSNKQALVNNHMKLHEFTDSDWQLSQNTSLPVVNKGENWLAFTIKNASQTDVIYYLSVRSSIKESEQKVYFRRGESAYQSVNNITLQANTYITELPLASNQTLDIVLYVHADAQHYLPIKILSSDMLVDNVSEAQFGYGIAIGGVVALAFTLMFLYSGNRNKMILLLSGYFITKALLLSVLLGINLHLFYPHYSQIKGLELPVLTAASVIFLVWFTVGLFKLKATQPKCAKMLKVFCWVLLVYMPISVQLPLIINLFICMLINLLTSLCLLLLGYIQLKKEHRLASLFIGTVALQLLFILIDIFSGSSALNIYGDNLSLYSTSFWLNAFCITYLLSREYFFQVEEQHTTQKEALASAITSKQAQEELLELQESSQELLEEKVQERTLELNIALQELESANKELAEINTRDELTGLFNRRFYDQKIMAEYRRSRRNLTPLSLMVVDIDHFKKVNDTYGHLAGDQCIVAVAKAFKHCLRRSSDMPCRYGGEEFSLILPETETKGAIALAVEIREYISASPVQYQELLIDLTVSIGVSTYKQQENAGTDELFSAADQALYQAKEQGRNQVQQHPINPPISS